MWAAQLQNSLAVCDAQVVLKVLSLVFGDATL